MKLWAIYFEPEDWVGFRETRRFSFSDRVESVFPSSFPFYGAVRTALLMKNQKFDPGNAERAGDIRMFGPFVFKNTPEGRKHYFPLPRNIYKTDSGYRVTPIVEIDGGYLPWKPEYRMDSKESMSGGLIELGDLELLRSNTQGVCKFDLVSTEKIFKKETHIGIAFEENRKKAKEGMIYSISSYRFPNGGFFMLTDDERTVELVSKLDGVFLGMKSRWAAVKVGEVNTTAFEPPDYENVAVALITPAVFDGGGMPKDRTILGKKVLTTAGIRKLVVSGWDLCKNRPKKIYHAVSPGAVYYLEGKVSGHVLNESKFTDFGFGRCVFMKYEKL